MQTLQPWIVRQRPDSDIRHILKKYFSEKFHSTHVLELKALNVVKLIIIFILISRPLLNTTCEIVSFMLILYYLKCK